MLTGLNPITVAAHFLLSMVLIAGAVVLLEVSGRGTERRKAGRARRRHESAASADAENVGPGRRTESTSAVAFQVRREIRGLGVALLIVAGLVLVLGTVVTGSGPHSGDATAPARLGFDPQTVSWLHADSVFLLLGLSVAMVLGLRLTNAPSPARRRATVLLAVIVVQGLVGYLQYFTGLPVALVAVHMVGRVPRRDHGRTSAPRPGLGVPPDQARRGTRQRVTLTADSSG